MDGSHFISFMRSRMHSVGKKPCATPDRRQVTSGGAFRHVIVIRLSHRFLLPAVRYFSVNADNQNRPAYVLKVDVAAPICAHMATDARASHVKTRPFNTR